MWNYLVVMKSAIKILVIFVCLFSVVLARPDNRTYTEVLDTLAVWIEPRNIKVYVVESPKAHILKNAFKIWDSAMRDNMNFVFVNHKDQADIAIDYIEQLSGTQVGITKTGHISIQGRIYLHKAVILIAKKDPIGFIQSDAALLKVTLHEIGHAIGMIGHSNSINDIMYYSTASTKNTSPSTRDIDTVNKLYRF